MRAIPSSKQIRSASDWIAIVASAVLLGIPQSAKSASLTYDVVNNPGWFVTDAWAGDHTTRVSGDSAVVGVLDSATTIPVGESTDVTDLTLNGDARLTGSASNTLTMSGGDLTVTNAVGGSLIEVRVTKLTGKEKKHVGRFLIGSKQRCEGGIRVEEPDSKWLFYFTRLAFLNRAAFPLFPEVRNKSLESEILL